MATQAPMSYADYFGMLQPQPYNQQPLAQGNVNYDYGNLLANMGTGIGSMDPILMDQMYRPPASMQPSAPSSTGFAGDPGGTLVMPQQGGSDPKFNLAAGNAAGGAPQMTVEQLRGMDAASLGQLSPAMLEQLASQGMLTRYANDNDSTDQFGNPLGPTYNLDLGNGQNRAIRTGGEAGVTDPYKSTGDRNLGIFLALAGGMGAYSAAAAGSTTGGTVGATQGTTAASTGAAGGASATELAAAQGGMYGNIGGGATAAELAGMPAGSVAGGGMSAAQAAAAANGGGYFDAAGKWIADNPSLAGSLAGAVIGGVSGAQDRTTTQTSTYTPSQDYLNYVNPMLANTLAYATGKPDAYTGPTSVSGGYLNDAKGAYNNLGAAGNAEMQQVRDMIQAGQGGYDAAVNPFASEANPYLQDAIGSATRGYVDNYNTLVAPKFASGSSFGNSGLGFAETLERENIGKQIADVSTNMNYDVYNLMAQLNEQYAGRQDASQQFKGTQSLAGANILGSLGESYAGRQDASAAARAAGLLGVGQGQQQNAQFNAGLAQNQYVIDQNALDARIRAGLQGANVNLGGTTTQTGFTPGNAASGALGGAIVGSQIGGNLGQGTSTTPGKKKTAPALFNTGSTGSIFQSNYQGI